MWVLNSNMVQNCKSRDVDVSAYFISSEFCYNWQASIVCCDGQMLDGVMEFVTG